MQSVSGNLNLNKEKCMFMKGVPVNGALRTHLSQTGIRFKCLSCLNTAMMQWKGLFKCREAGMDQRKTMGLNVALEKRVKGRKKKYSNSFSMTIYIFFFIFILLIICLYVTIKHLIVFIVVFYSFLADLFLISLLLNFLSFHCFYFCI